MRNARHAVASAFDVNRRSITPVKGLVTALPVAALFALGVVGVGRTTVIAMAIGANLIAIVSLVGAPRLSLRLALIDALGIGCSVFLGAVSAFSPALHDLVLLPWCFLMGLAVLFGQTQGIIGSQVIVAFVVLGRQAASPWHALALALLVMLGAVTETLALLALRLPPSLRYQRQVLAQAMDAVATYALADPATSALSALAAIDTAQRVLSPASLFGRADARDLQAIIDQLRRSRIELTALAGLRLRMGEVTLADAIARCEEAYANALSDIATEIRCPLVDAPEPPQFMRLRIEELASMTALAAGTDAVLGRQAHAHLISLRAQLRTCRDLARMEREASTRSSVTFSSDNTRADMSMAERVAFIRSHLRTTDAGFRHAIRFSVAVTASAILSQVLALPRGYWVPFAVAVILKPDYNTLLKRGVSRVLGTAMGATLAAVLEAELHPSYALSVGIVLVVASVAYAVWPASFALSIGLVSSLVLLMLSSVTHNALHTAGDRFLDVAIGAVIATAAYLLWPSSQRADVESAEAAFVTAYGTYVRSVLDHVLRRDTVVNHARLSRSAHYAFARLELAVQRALNEPTATRGDGETGSTLATALRLLRATHALRLGSVPEAVDDHPTALIRYRDNLGPCLTGEIDTGALEEDFEAVRRDLALSENDSPFIATLDELTNAVTTWQVQHVR